jgi:biopolymer transport protein ExbD
MKFDVEHKPLASFSFSSLTDIVLLLLIFFLLTSQFVIGNGVKVELPKTKNAEKSQRSPLIVSIDANGKTYFKGKEITLEKLDKFFRSTKESDKQSLIIRADKSAALEYVVKVIDLARGAGIVKFTVQTEKTN